MILNSNRNAWCKLGLQGDFVRKKFKQYFGEKNYTIINRCEATELLGDILSQIQEKMYVRMMDKDTRYFICDLIVIFDFVYKIYSEEKDIREKTKKDESGIKIEKEILQINKEIYRNIIDSTNIWFDNSVLYNVIKDDSFFETKKIDCELLIDIYIYGVASQNFSLLNTCKIKKMGKKEFFLI